jgi:hypothetical protein
MLFGNKEEREDEMKLTKYIVVAGLVTALNLPTMAQDAEQSFSYKPKSEKAAKGWSTAGFLAPIGAGIAVWSMQKGKKESFTTIRWYKDYYGNWQPEEYQSYHNIEPDRTLPVTLILSGVIVGPSLGYFYGGCTKKGFISIGKRIGISGGTFLLGYMAFTDVSGDDYTPGLILISGGVLTIASAYHDIAVVDDTVRKHNASLANISIAPTYISSSGAPGVEVMVRF